MEGDDQSEVLSQELRVLSQECARGIPLLWLPTASDLRRALSKKGKNSSAINEAVHYLVNASHTETHYLLARSLQPLWKTACSEVKETCPHLLALRLAEECAKAPVQRATPPHSLLLAPIKAATDAWLSSACCSERAKSLLFSWLADYQKDVTHCDNGGAHLAADLIVPRALVDMTASGCSSKLTRHVELIVGHGKALAGFLQNLAFVGYETTTRAKVVREVWPRIMEKALDALDRKAAIRCPYDQSDLAALVPTGFDESEYLSQEIVESPIAWIDVRTLESEIGRWISHVAGNSQALDELVVLLRTSCSRQYQVQVGLSWVEQVVASEPASLANRTVYLSEWLRDVEKNALASKERETWLKIVDHMTVAGDQNIISTSPLRRGSNTRLDLPGYRQR